MTWKFVGTLGGQNAYECTECGSVSLESGRLVHDMSHEKQDEGQPPLFRLTPPTPSVAASKSSTSPA